MKEVSTIVLERSDLVGEYNPDGDVWGQLKEGVEEATLTASIVVFEGRIVKDRHGSFETSDRPLKHTKCPPRTSSNAVGAVG